MRPNLDAVMLGIAWLLSTRATCAKRQVGCVLTDVRGRILSAGYNGVASGLPHCTEHPCGGADRPAGSDTCQAVHAELNALLTCCDPDKIHTCYVTTMPCNNCMKTLLNTACQRIVYADDHEDGMAVRIQWKAAGRSVTEMTEFRSI